MLECDEALAAVEDPRELQRKLRQALGDIAPAGLLSPHTRHNGHKRMVPKDKTKTRRRAGTAQASTMTTCPKCGKEFDRRGLSMHMARKHRNDAPAVGD